MVFYAAFQQYFSLIMSTALIIHVFPRFNQYLAGALKCLAIGHWTAKKKKKKKKPGDPVRLEPRTPGLRVKQSTTEARRTSLITCWNEKKRKNSQISPVKFSGFTLTFYCTVCYYKTR